jgi:Asp-tRNA(Asn)/Glu-tRNA(Gln) amidotransferase A subunit family amidase
VGGLLTQPAAPATELIRRLHAGELSCAEALEPFLSRIADREPELRAWVTVGAELARERARALDALPAAQRLRLPLFGLPVGIKDIFDTATLPTSYGSEIYRDHRPARDATMVAQLRDAGAVVVGKTATAELACMHPSQTRNPLDPERTPGGSSGGSAAAVAASMVPIATGTQTAGSIIRPASYCAVVGYKPSFGLLSRDGAFPLCASLDTVGLFGQHPEDVRAVTAALAAGAQPTTRASLPGELAAGARDANWRPRIGFVRAAWDRLEPQARDAFDVLLADIERLGAELEELALADELDQLSRAQETVQRFETAHALAPEAARTQSPRLSDELREYVEAARAIPVADYFAARRLADERRWRWQERLAEIDALLAPAALGPPPEGLEYTGDPWPCRAWTLLGVPCVAAPLAWTPAGLPIGVQLIGSLQRDAGVLDVAAWLHDRLALPRRARAA